MQVRRWELALEDVERVAVVVAHPDDETLWCGGLMLLFSGCRYHIVTLCRAGDPDRAPRFRRVLQFYGASGAMADLDDGPEQAPLDPGLVEATLLDLIGPFDPQLVLTHGPAGEYTRHLRHEEVSRAVQGLWRRKAVKPAELWMFAYEDGDRSHLPRPVEEAPLHFPLPEAVWESKYHVMTELYGFDAASWEARTTPREEAFWQLYDRERHTPWVTEGGP